MPKQIIRLTLVPTLALAQIGPAVVWLGADRPQGLALCENGRFSNAA